jgi:hypothetical protein
MEFAECDFLQGKAPWRLPRHEGEFKASYLGNSAIRNSTRTSQEMSEHRFQIGQTVVAAHGAPPGPYSITRLLPGDQPRTRPCRKSHPNGITIARLASLWAMFVPLRS